MPERGHLRHIITITSTAFLMSSPSHPLTSITTLNYGFSFVISSVAIVDIGTHLKNMGDALQSAHAKHVVGLKSRMLLEWCIRALQVMFDAVA